MPVPSAGLPLHPRSAHHLPPPPPCLAQAAAAADEEAVEIEYVSAPLELDFLQVRRTSGPGGAHQLQLLAGAPCLGTLWG